LNTPSRHHRRRRHWTLTKYLIGEIALSPRYVTSHPFSVPTHLQHTLPSHCRSSACNQHTSPDSTPQYPLRSETALSAAKPLHSRHRVSPTVKPSYYSTCVPHSSSLEQTSPNDDHPPLNDRARKITRCIGGTPRSYSRSCRQRRVYDRS
jgi:hypothetical protein